MVQEGSRPSAGGTGVPPKNTFSLLLLALRRRASKGEGGFGDTLPPWIASDSNRQTMHWLLGTEKLRKSSVYDSIDNRIDTYFS